jgi:hypothetical protein
MSGEIEAQDMVDHIKISSGHKGSRSLEHGKTNSEVIPSLLYWTERILKASWCTHLSEYLNHVHLTEVIVTYACTMLECTLNFCINNETSIRVAVAQRSGHVPHC